MLSYDCMSTKIGQASQPHDTCLLFLNGCSCLHTALRKHTESMRSIAVVSILALLFTHAVLTGLDVSIYMEGIAFRGHLHE